MSLHRALLLLALSLRLGAGAAFGQEVQGTVDDRQRTKAAEAFAGAVAHEGTEDFVRAFRLGLEAAYKLDPVPGGSATRSLSPAPPRVGVEADSRYQQNLDAARKESTAKIWGGKRTKANSFPDVVAVLGGGALCTGTLIAPDVVLTAAHCYCGNVNENVIVGLDINDPTSQLVKVVRSEAQIGCDKSPKEGDLALLFLEKRLSIAPRRLAQPEWIDAATSVHLVGFGRTEDPTSEATGIQREVDVVVASSNCAGTVSTPTQSVLDSSYYDCTKGRELVAGRPMLDRDSCNGDSGGPALVKGPDGQLYLAAATSRAIQRPGLHACGDGGIYARTDGAALDWIRSKIAAVGVGRQASLSSQSFRMSMKLGETTPDSETDRLVNAAPDSAAIFAVPKRYNAQKTVNSPSSTTSVDDIRTGFDFPVPPSASPTAGEPTEAKPSSGSPLPSAGQGWKGNQAKLSQYLKTLPKKAIEGTLERKQDGTLVLSPTARPDVEIPLANSGDFSSAVAGPPVQVQLDVKSSDNVRANKVDLSLLTQWKKSSQYLPRARFETVHRAIDNLAATSAEAFRSEASSSSSQQEILVQTQELERDVSVYRPRTVSAARGGRSMKAAFDFGGGR